MTVEDATADLERRFTAYVQQYALFAPEELLIIGVSGGVDSMVLMDLLDRVSDNLHAVHVNYGFRGAESDGDEDLVREVCDLLKIPVTVHRATETWRREISGKSLHEAARDLRYDVMYNAARAHGSSTVAVGHHLDDQAETVLLRMFRGTGVQALAGMRPSRPLRRHEDVSLVRPLLFATRGEIASYAASRNIRFREDPSNDDPRYDRARIRGTILPAVRQAFGESAVKNIGEAASRVGEIVDHGIGPLIESDLQELVREHTAYVRIHLEGLAELPTGRRRLVLLRALRRYLPHVPHRTGVIEQIEALMSGRPGKQVRFDSGSIWRDRNWLALVPEPMVLPSESSPVRSDHVNKTAFGLLVVERLDLELAGPFDDDLNVEVMDGSVLDEPLSLGPWRPGDRFQPLGLSGTKKVSDFLTDEKVPTYLRRSIPVLKSGDRVAWIPGLRLAHPFRLTDRSKSAVRMRFDDSTGA